MDFNFTFPSFDGEAANKSEERWNSIAKPLGSLGLLEKAVVKIAGLTGDADYSIDKRAVVTMCADNGVVAQGITQAGSEITAIVARNMTSGDACVCRMAKIAHADVIPVDIGIIEDMNLPGLVNRRVAAGTGDMSKGSAMTRDDAVKAVNHGIEMVRQLKEKGYKIILTGEMGIGNTATSSAVAAVLLDKAPAEVTGRGAGLSAGGLSRKIEVIERSLKINNPDKNDALDVLSKVGGFDIAGIAGLFLGGALFRVPVLVDGFISAVSALVACKIEPKAKNAMLASHVSAEPAGRMILDALGLEPMITAGMYLGEGSGAVAALPLLDMAYAVYGGMVTFNETDIEAYIPLD